VGAESGLSDLEFVANLRAVTERYLRAVDAWETAYQKYYRMPGYAAKACDDLEPEERAYLDRRNELEELLPRARRLCLKHNLRDPFPGLLRISLGRYAPQHRVDPAIGRSERSHLTNCLVQLNDLCREWHIQHHPSAQETDLPRPTLRRRLKDYIY
jgi:hypothetical protein